MGQLIQTVKKYKWPILGIALAIIIFAIAIVLKQGAAQRAALQSPIPTATPTPSPAPIGIGGNIDELTSKLGKPLGGNAIPKNGVAEFKSKNLSLNDEVVYQDGKAAFYKQIVLVEEKRTGTGIQKQLGQPEQKLFGPSSEFGYFLYAYPTKGTAYIANDGTDNVTEVWYFNPTSLETFMKTWAVEYSVQPQNNGY